MAWGELELDRRLVEALGTRLRVLRWESRLSQADVATRAGINRNHYQLLESGLSDRLRKSPANPRLATLVALCDVYDTTVPALMFDVFTEAGLMPAKRRRRMGSA